MRIGGIVGLDGPRHSQTSLDCRAKFAMSARTETYGHLDSAVVRGGCCGC